MDRLRVNTKVADPRFVQYWLMGWYFCKSSPYYINQTTGLQNIDLTMMLAKEKIYYPTLLKQLNIIKYLDKKCGEIVFDSDKDNWSQYTSVFYDNIRGRKQLIFMIEA